MIDRRSAIKVLGALPLARSAAAQTSALNGKKVLRYAFEVAETGFDPVQLGDLYSRIVTAHIFDGLYRYDYLARPFKIVPCTADGMPEVSEDFRTWTVRLKRGIYFQDDAAFKGQAERIDCAGLRLFLETLLRPALEGAGVCELERRQDARHDRVA